AGGTETLSGTNTYAGVTTISAGTLALTGTGSISNSSHVVANAAFDISGLAGAGTSIQSLAGTGNVALGGKALTITNASDTFAGAIGGTGGLAVTGGTQ
ncbi:autotransporter-associated beta strand repeat-containing protein, partial [Bradyrhizobium sp. UBA2491]